MDLKVLVLSEIDELDKAKRLQGLLKTAGFEARVRPILGNDFTPDVILSVGIRTLIVDAMEVDCHRSGIPVFRYKDNLINKFDKGFKPREVFWRDDDLILGLRAHQVERVVL